MDLTEERVIQRRVDLAPEIQELGNIKSVITFLSEQ